jgi:hypothetical protein
MLAIYIVGVKDITLRNLLVLATNNLRHYRFCVSSDGSFVMAQPSACRGDLICVLFGCDTPVLLRKIDEYHYTFVGECYTHGIMYGESIEGMRAGKYKPKDIMIY